MFRFVLVAAFLVSPLLASGQSVARKIPQPAASTDAVSAVDLQTKITNALTNAYRVRSKTGSVVATSSINVIDGYGGGLEAYGAALPANVFQQTQYSSLEWNGARGGDNALIHYENAQYALRDLSLWGNTKANILAATPGLATFGDIGLLVRRSLTIGTGKVCAQNLLFDHWDRAIQLGTNEVGRLANCDESSWNYLQFYRCNTAVKTMHRMVMGHHFLAPQIHICTNGFEILGGGNITIDGGGFYSTNGAATSAALIRYRNDTTTELGQNNGAITVNSFKFDSQVRGIRALDMESVTGSLYAAFIRFNTPQFPYDASWSDSWGGPMFVISGNTHVIIDGSEFLYPGAIRWHVTAGTFAKVTVINGKFFLGTNYTTFLDTANSHGTLYVRFWNNSSTTLGTEVSETTLPQSGVNVPATVPVNGLLDNGSLWRPDGTLHRDVYYALAA